MNTYFIKPKYEQNVSERTLYSNGEGKHFTIERYYRTVDIIVKSDVKPIINIECVFGENMEKRHVSEQQSGIYCISTVRR